jgi:hypothetical protein
MRVAALYDIHGNVPALEAVLGEIRDAGFARRDIRTRRTSPSGACSTRRPSGRCWTCMRRPN